MRAAKYTTLDHANSVAELELPQPRVFTAYIDHQRSRVHSIHRTGAWIVALGDAAAQRLVDEGLRGAQQELKQFELDDALLVRARLTCERLLAGQFDVVGWTLEVEWK